MSIEHVPVGLLICIGHSTTGEALSLNDPPVHIALLDASYSIAHSVGLIVHAGVGFAKVVVVGMTYSL